MAVAFDAQTMGATFTTTSPNTFTHTPVGTPRGVVVCVTLSVGADTVSAVTYGGVAMTQILNVADGGGEGGRAYVFFLGSSIPTGAQTVSITHSGGAFNKAGSCVTVTAGGDTEIGDSDSAAGVIDDPSIALVTTSTSLRVGALHTGLNALTDFTELTGMTNIGGYTNSFRCGSHSRQTTPSSGSFTFGYNHVASPAQADTTLVGVAVQEVASVAVTGTVAVTQADQTSTASGTVGSVALTGTVAVTQANQTSTASGTVSGAGIGAPTLVDEGHRFEAWTLPHGTFTRKFDLTKWVTDYSISQKFSSISDGRFGLPADFPKLARLFNVDKTDHANDVGSIIRVLDADLPILHYVLKGLDDRWSSEGQTITGLLEGMDYFLDRALVPNFDYPAAPTVEPDWHYGIPSILNNSGIEDDGVTNDGFDLWVEDSVTAGTFTVTFDAQTTGALAWNIDAPALQTAIEGLSNVQDILISGAGTETNPWVIEVIDPAGFNFNVSINSGGLTGGIVQLRSTAAGGFGIATPWTRSFNPVTGLFHGTYTNFQPSTVQVHSGAQSLYVKGALGDWPDSFPGAQQIVSVTGGRLYRASVWVYPLFARDYRFVIRTTDETLIASVDASLTANSWQQLTLSVLMPTYVTSIIFRLSCISNTNGHEFYLDDALLAPGMPAATYGAIMLDLLGAIQALGILTWVTPTWTDLVDSSGAAWDQERVWSVKHRQSLLQLVEYADRWNYESDGIHWNIANDRFEWGLYNPSTGGANFLGSGMALVGKILSETGTMSKRIPDASQYYAEGDLGYWAEFTDTAMNTAWGPLQKSFFNAQALDTAGLLELATRLVADSATRTEGLSTRLQAAPLKPWRDFSPGDRNIMVNLAPLRAREHLRCMAIVATKSASDAAPVYEAHWDSVVYQGEAAVLETVRRLVRKFESERPKTAPFDGRPVAPANGGGGSAPTLVIAAVNSSDSTKARADFICFGTDDHLLFQTAINQIIAGGGGRLLVAEGLYVFGGEVVFPLTPTFSIKIEGMGTGTVIKMDAAANSNMFHLMNSFDGELVFSNLEMDGDKATQTSGTWAAIVADPNSLGTLTVDQCEIHDVRGDGIFSNRSALDVNVIACDIHNNSVNGLNLLVEGRFVVTGNRIYDNTEHGIKADGANNMTLADNWIFTNTLDGYSAGGAFQASGVVAVGNHFIQNRQGFAMEGFDSLIAGNYSNGNDTNGFHVGSVRNLSLVGNVAFQNGEQGFLLASAGSGAFGGVASGNASTYNGQHGIRVTGEDWLVQGNRVESNGHTTDNTYDGISVSSGGDDCAILTNQIRQDGSANQMRYGISIEAGAANCWVAGNDARGAFVTAAYNDAGTGTINVWAGTFGDNY